MEYIDLWLVERILLENDQQELRWLKNLLANGTRIKNENNRYVTSDLEALRKRIHDSRESQNGGDVQLETG